MDSRSFTTKMEQFHREWLSKATGIPYSTNDGIDLSNDKVSIEIKCRCDIYHHHFVIHEYQFDAFKKENPDKELFWAFILYGLTKNVKEMTDKNLENYVTFRQVWFLPWNWAKQFPVSNPKTGPYVYVPVYALPLDESYHKIRKEKGILRIPKNTVLEDILINKP
jgi:hypothetical protein